MELRRQAQNLALAGIDIGAVPHRGRIAQSQPERERIACEREIGTEGEIGLVDVAVADVTLYPVEALAVFPGGPTVPQRPGIGAAAGAEVLTRDPLRRIEHAEPQQWQTELEIVFIKLAPARLEQIAELIGEISGEMKPGASRLLHTREGFGEFPEFARSFA